MSAEDQGQYMILDRFLSITVSCFDRDCESVVESIESSIAKWSLTERFSRSKGKFDVSVIPEEGSLSGLTLTRMWVFEPKARPGGTVMVTNLADGWSSLSYAVSRHLSCDAYMFTISREDDEQPHQSLSLVRAGQLIRIVRSLWDSDRWDFFQKGEVLDVEDVAMYRKRRIRDRVTRDYVLDMATGLKWPLADPDSWTSSRQAVSFTETRKA